MAEKIVSRAEAIAQGLKRYFTGKPCKHGHIAQRLLPSGVCNECCNAYKRKFARENKEIVNRRSRALACQKS